MERCANTYTKCMMCYCRVLQLTHSEVHSCDQANLAASFDVIHKTGVLNCPKGLQNYTDVYGIMVQ